MFNKIFVIYRVTHPRVTIWLTPLIIFPNKQQNIVHFQLKTKDR